MNVSEAWEKYAADCAEMLQKMVDDPICERYPALKARAYFMMQQNQAQAYNTVMAPHGDCPTFSACHFIMPLYSTANQPNPDFHYPLAFFNPRRTWKITGQRNSAHWVDLQAGQGWFGDELNGGLGNYDLDDFEINPDGSFEIIASPDEHPGNWIRLDPAARINNIQVRSAIYDWANEVPPSFQVEAMDDLPAASTIHDEEEIARRLAISADTIRFVIGRWTTSGSPRLARKPGVNTFAVFGGDAGEGGANPTALYGQAVFEVGPDEALIIESDWPSAKYWGISLGTWWWETIDGTHYHSSLNGKQAVPDSDGKVRAVVCHGDPGVANWLDPAGWETGIILFRWYKPEAKYGVTTKVVKRDELRAHLPGDVATVSAEARKATVEARKRGVLRWFGW